MKQIVFNLSIACNHRSKRNARAPRLSSSFHSPEWFEPIEVRDPFGTVHLTALVMAIHSEVGGSVLRILGLWTRAAALALDGLRRTVKA